MGFFHDKDVRCPCELFAGEVHFSIVAESGGIGFDICPRCKHLLGGGIMQTVLCR